MTPINKLRFVIRRVKPEGEAHENDKGRKLHILQQWWEWDYLELEEMRRIWIDPQSDGKWIDPQSDGKWIDVPVEDEE